MLKNTEVIRTGVYLDMYTYIYVQYIHMHRNMQSSSSRYYYILSYSQYELMYIYLTIKE